MKKSSSRREVFQHALDALRQQPAGTRLCNDLDSKHANYFFSVRVSPGWSEATGLGETGRLRSARGGNRVIRLNAQTPSCLLRQPQEHARRRVLDNNTIIGCVPQVRSPRARRDPERAMFLHGELHLLRQHLDHPPDRPAPQRHGDRQAAFITPVLGSLIAIPPHRGHNRPSRDPTMKTRYRLLFLSSTALGLALAWGCSDEQVGPNGSTGGTVSGGGGAGGTSTQSGGASSVGGKAGTGGAAAGAGGAISGGVGGSAGGVAGTVSGGAPGAGGTDVSSSGGAAGVGGSLSSSGGMAGRAGSESVAGGGQGGAQSPPAARSCVGQCVNDDDCKEGIFDSGYRCDPTSKRCVNPTAICKVHSDCIAFATIWFVSCAADDECLIPGEVCVDAGGVGKCAEPPAATSCFLPGQTLQSVKRFGAAGFADVCASDAGRCSKGSCVLGCAETGCLAGNGSTCNRVTGLCGCSQSSECTAPGVSVCNSTTQRCECGGNADCSIAGRDQCVAGSCGCSSETVCPMQFDNVTRVCE